MVRDDRSVRILLGVIAVLLGLNLVVSVSGLTGPRTAIAAGIPDSGAQLQAVVDQLKEVGKKVDRMQAYLESGALTVKVKETKSDK